MSTHHVFRVGLGLLVVFCLLTLSVLAFPVVSVSAQAASSSPSPSPTSGQSLFLPSDVISAQSAQAGVLRSRPVEINLAALPLSTGEVGAQSLDTLTFNFFPDVTLIGQAIRTEPSEVAADGYVWVGTVAGDPYSQAVLSVSGGQVEGFVSTRDAFYQITNSGGTVQIVNQIDPATFTSRQQDGLEPPPISPEAQALNNADVAAASTTVNRIDLLVAYTANARAAQGGTTPMENAIQAAVAAANQAYLNSDVNIRLRLVGTLEVAYTEVNMNSDLSAITNGTGALSGVPGQRNTFAADLVTFVTNEDAQTSGYCGLGWVMPSNLITAAFAPYGYNVVALDCLPGGITMVHELGHNMGSRHDAANAGAAGAYSYSYGYLDPLGRFRTIMSYSNNCADPCPAINYFSNRTRTINGLPMGNAAADNALSLNNTASTVAAFRSGGTTLVTLTPTPALGIATFTPVPAATGVPTCTANVGAGNTAALISAINTANSNGAGNDVICLAAGSTYSFSSGANVTISGSNFGSVALPTINTSITILGNGATLTRTGSSDFRFFFVNGITSASAQLFLNGLTLSNGRMVSASYYSSLGGAVMNVFGTLTITRSKLTGNTAYFGGAVFGWGPLTITESEFTGNSAYYGGAVMASNPDPGAYSLSATISRTLFSQNMAELGSAVYGERLTNNVSVTGSCFVNNTNTAVDNSTSDPAPTVNAINNWWNSSAGPSVAATQTGGDFVGSSGVNYTPFANAQMGFCGVATPTPTYTPTDTYTPSATFTPTYTRTPTYTPTATFTPTNTFTPTYTFTPSNTPTNTSVPPVTLVFPTNGASASSLRPVFVWDALPNAVSYELWLTLGTTPATKVYSGTLTSYTPPADLVSGVNYAWQVFALFSGGVKSPVSSTFTVFIPSTDGAAPQTAFFQTHSVTLSWARVSSATAYEVQVSTSPTFTTLAYPAATTTSLSHSTPSLDNGLYYWRVQALSGATAGAWSAVQSFVVAVP